jgi:hypothetical protein
MDQNEDPQDERCLLVVIQLNFKYYSCYPYYFSSLSGLTSLLEAISTINMARSTPMACQSDQISTNLFISY